MKQTIFVTKYALTQGIFESEMDVKENPIHFKKQCYGKLSRNSCNTGLYNDEFHLTMEEAIVDAEKRRLAKIKSLEKHISRLKNLIF